MSGRKRASALATFVETEGGYQVLLEGKPLETPAGAPLVLPTRALADAVAGEWRTQAAKPRLETMPMTRLANTAIDRVRPAPVPVIRQIAAFGKADVLCYRAEAPAALVERQAASWDPLLAWARERYGTALGTTSGIGFVEQPADALAALEKAVAAHDVFVLAALHAMATVLGSAVLALAMAEGRVAAAEAFALAHLDETYQIECWGRDAESKRRRQARLDELIDAERFLLLLRA